MEAKDLAPLLDAIHRFGKMALTTTRENSDGSRVVEGVSHAVAMSKATDEVFAAAAGLQRRIGRDSGIPVANLPPGIQLLCSDSPDGPWELPAPEDVQIVATPIAKHGHGSLVSTALENLAVALGFPHARWNRAQARNPGGDHNRWHAGEVIPADVFRRVTNAAELLRSVEQSLLASESPPPTRIAASAVKPLAVAAASVWDSIEAIDDVLIERVACGAAFQERYRSPNEAPKPSVEADLEPVVAESDPTGRSRVWATGGDLRYFEDLLRSRGVYDTVEPYLSRRRGPRKETPSPDPNSSLSEVLAALSNPRSVRQIWTELLQDRPRLRAYVQQATSRSGQSDPSLAPPPNSESANSALQVPPSGLEAVVPKAAAAQATGRQPDRPSQRSAEEAVARLPDDARFSASKLAELIGVNKQMLRKRLERWRESNLDGWTEDTEPKSKEARYLYRVGSVRKVLLDAVRASSIRPSTNK